MLFYNCIVKSSTIKFYLWQNFGIYIDYLCSNYLMRGCAVGKCPKCKWIFWFCCQRCMWWCRWNCHICVRSMFAWGAPRNEMVRRRQMPNILWFIILCVTNLLIVVYHTRIEILLYFVCILFSLSPYGSGFWVNRRRRCGCSRCYSFSECVLFTI